MIDAMFSVAVVSQASWNKVGERRNRVTCLLALSIQSSKSFPGFGRNRSKVSPSGMSRLLNCLSSFSSVTVCMKSHVMSYEEVVTSDIFRGVTCGSLVSNIYC